MKFSILVPIYNVGDYLNEMLSSVESQTFTDYELILVDDGSTDRCPEICDNYCKTHPETKVIHKTNGGLISARREGIQAAAGEYLIFLDADDMLKEKALEKINQVIDENSCDMVIYNADMYDGTERIPFFLHELPQGIVPDKRAIYDKMFLSYSLNAMCLKAVKREIVDIDRDYSRFYDCSIAEDLLQSVPLVINSERIYYLDESLYDYRITSGMTHKCNPKYYWSNRKISLDIRERLKEEGIEDFDVKVSFHILIAAYAGTTQMQYAQEFDKGLLEKIRNDDEFRKAWNIAWKSSYSGYFSKKQKLILKLLHDGNFAVIRMLLKVKNGN